MSRGTRALRSSFVTSRSPARCTAAPTRTAGVARAARRAVPRSEREGVEELDVVGLDAHLAVVWSPAHGLARLLDRGAVFEEGHRQRLVGPGIAEMEARD